MMPHINQKPCILIACMEISQHPWISHSIHGQLIASMDNSRRPYGYLAASMETHSMNMGISQHPRTLSQRIRGHLIASMEISQQPLEGRKLLDSIHEYVVIAARAGHAAQPPRKLPN